MLINAKILSLWKLGFSLMSFPGQILDYYFLLWPGQVLNSQVTSMHIRIVSIFFSSYCNEISLLQYLFYIIYLFINIYFICCLILNGELLVVILGCIFSKALYNELLLVFSLASLLITIFTFSVHHCPGGWPLSYPKMFICLRMITQKLMRQFFSESTPESAETTEL